MASLGIVPSLKKSTRESRPFFAAGVSTSGLPPASVTTPPHGVHGLGEVDGEALVLLELVGVAGDALGLGQLLDLGAGRLHFRPCRRRGADAGLLQQVGAVVEDAAVGGLGNRVEVVAVLGRLDHGLEHLVQRELRGGQLVDPLVGGELRGPHHVQGEHRVGVRLRLGVLNHLLALLVHVRRQLDEGDLLLRVLLVPAVDDLLHDAGAVLGSRVRDRAATRERRALGLPR